MGSKGSQVQRVTSEFNVQIKFPDKAQENGEMPAPSPERSSDPNIIRITGTKPLIPDPFRTEMVWIHISTICGYLLYRSHVEMALYIGHTIGFSVLVEFGYLSTKSLP